MKKKLLVIVLVFCCVWGVFASKLTDAAKSGDFDTMKKQIELLDADISDLNTALAYCLSNWRFDDGHEKCLKFLMQKGAVIADSTLTRMIDNNSYVLLDYLLKNKYLDINRNVYFNDGYNKATVSITEYAIYKGCKGETRFNSPDCNGYLTAFVLTTYKPYVSDSPYFDNVSPAYWLFTGNIPKLRAWIKESESGSFRSNFMGPLTAYWPAYLFIQDQKAIEWLKDVDQMAPTYGFTGWITPFYINEIVPKYMSSITPQEDLEFMQFLINYSADMNHDAAMATVKAYIEKVGSLEHGIRAIGWSPVFLFPFRQGNLDAIKLLLEAKGDDCNVFDGGSIMSNDPTSSGAKTYKFYYNALNYRYFIAYWNKDDKLYDSNKIELSQALYNGVKEIFEPIKIERERIAAEKAEQERIEQERKAEEERIAREKAEEEARIAREKAEAERKEKEKIAEEKLEKEYLDTFIQQYKNQLDGFIKKSKKVKGKFVLKIRYYTKDQMVEYGSPLTIEENQNNIRVYWIYNGHIVQTICSLSKSDGYTVDIVKRVLRKALDSFIVEE